MINPANASINDIASNTDMGLTPFTEGWLTAHRMGNACVELYRNDVYFVK